MSDVAKRQTPPLSTLTEPTLTREPREYHHGRSPASWVGSMTALAGALVGEDRRDVTGSDVRVQVVAEVAHVRAARAVHEVGGRPDRPWIGPPSIKQPSKRSRSVK